MNPRTARRPVLLALLAALLVPALTLLPLVGQAQDTKAMTTAQMVAAATKNITTITIAQAKEELEQKVLFLDVREENEFKKGHIPGAVLIPRGLLEFSIGNQVPDKATKIVVYCKVGGRGALATDTLVKMGYTNVSNMALGWDAWLAAGYPAE